MSAESFKPLKLWYGAHTGAEALDEHYKLQRHFTERGLMVETLWLWEDMLRPAEAPTPPNFGYNAPPAEYAVALEAYISPVIEVEIDDPASAEEPTLPDEFSTAA